ncbi:DnaJ C-terminal domain-containing protein [Aristophania vespae]|uniref:DnaJ C-terminal domain-containing protein n=1 Tax=Aristophania vespae TaxID=2697033 RepID=UPI002351AD72|nr:DnaJ C-terminal domain-containing protein [Aristophania vespae]UMM64307.1 Curved DNA-binding protein [Aristophania vespae]
MIDPYATLGIAKTATDKEIRSAYRRLAKQYHPDHNPNNAKAEEKFKAIGKAYGILGDKEKRARFDRGEIDENGQERSPFGGGFGGGTRGYGQRQGFQSEDDLGAFFSDMFGAGGFRTPPRPRRGEDLHGEITISFEEAALGDKREIDLGTGQKIAVNIPPGVEEGMTLRVKGKGMAGHPGHDGTVGPAGDVLLKIHVKPDPYYVREGRNLRVTQDIDLKTALLGGKIPVRTPKGTVAVSVAAHSDSGTILRLKGRGIEAHGRSAAGDLLVTLRVVLGKLDSELQKLIEGYYQQEASSEKAS